MNVEALFSAAEAAGLRLERRSEGVLHVAPRGRLTPALRDALLQHKAAVLAVLREREAGPLGGFSNEALCHHTGVHEFMAPAWGLGGFYLVMGPQEALRLEGTGTPAGRIYCCCLVLDWRLGGLSAVAQAFEARRRLADNTRVPCVREGRA